MEAGNLPAVQQHAAHLHRQLDPVVTNRSIVIFDGLDDVGDFFRNLELRQLDQLTEGLVTLETDRLKVRFMVVHR